MARLPDLIAFAQTHSMKIGTISDLIAYRHKHDNLVREVRRETIQSFSWRRMGYAYLCRSDIRYRTCGSQQRGYHRRCTGSGTDTCAECSGRTFWASD